MSPEGASLEAVQGHHFTADLLGCDPAHPWMTDVAALRTACVDQVRLVGLSAVAECFHAFTPVEPGKPAGITGVVLLAESHLAVHTWPESGVVTLDVFVCNLGADNQGRAQTLLDALVEGFNPGVARRQGIRRGMPTAAST